MNLTTEQLAILAHVVAAPQSWADHAEKVGGASAVLAKIAKYRDAWLAAKDLPGYQTRAQQDVPPPPTPEQEAAAAQRVVDEAARTVAKADSVVQYLRDHTPDEVDAYILDAVADLPPSARPMFRKMGLMLCVLSKQNLR